MRIGDFVSDMIPEAQRETKKGGTVWQRVISGEPGGVVRVHVEKFRRKDGTTFPVEVCVGSIVYGGRRRVLGSALDVSARRRVEERLLHQAFYDPLTGLPNRALFLDRLERALARAARARYAVALLFLDLDGFKAINEGVVFSRLAVLGLPSGASRNARPAPAKNESRHAEKLTS